MVCGLACRWAISRSVKTPAARIEEEIVVIESGTEIMTKFPAQTLFVANRVLRSAALPVGRYSVYRDG
jgi:hypothetical protein